MCTRSLVPALVVCALCAATLHGFAQPIKSNQRQLAGGFLGLQGAFYASSIDVLTGASDCGVFDQGSGWNFIFGGLAEFPLGRKLNLAPRIVWDDHSGTFSTTHSNNSALVNGVPATVDMQYTMAVTLRQASFDLPLKWMPFPRNNFYGISGPSLGVIFANHYLETESILSPSNGYFKENGRQDRNLREGSFANIATVQFGWMFGIGYDLPISHYTFLSPEISAVLGFTSVMKDTSWTVTTVRFTASLKTDISALFRSATTNEELPSERESTPDREVPNDHVLHLPVPTASVTVMGLTPDGDQTPHPTLKVEEYVSTDLQPVLNYIFFPENGAEIPDRYVHLTKEQTDAFTDTALIEAKTMELYTQTLNIFGRRLRDNPKATIAIIGCNSDNGVEKGNTTLSAHRAKAVREYLTSVWGISPLRITTTAQNLPNDASRQGSGFGDEENRRAELWCSDQRVMSPITLAGMERTATPPRIRMYMHSDHDSLIETWHAEAKQRGKVLAKISGTGKIPKTFDWVLSSLADSLIQHEEPVQFALTVTDGEGRSSTSETSITLTALTVRKKRELRIADKRIDKFSLFLFDYDQSVLSKRTEAVLALVVNAVKPTSTVSVIGFCDRTGEAEHNMQLSGDRAKTVAEYITKHAHPAACTAEGRGDKELLFDNVLPEGRYFSRTVYVRVETPIIE